MFVAQADLRIVKIKPPLIFDDPNRPSEVSRASIIYCRQKVLSFSFPISPIKIQDDDQEEANNSTVNCETDVSHMIYKIFLLSSKLWNDTAGIIIFIYFEKYA